MLHITGIEENETLCPFDSHTEFFSTEFFVNEDGSGRVEFQWHDGTLRVFSAEDLERRIIARDKEGKDTATTRFCLAYIKMLDQLPWRG